MDRADRIARLSIIPLVLILLVLLVIQIRSSDAGERTARAAGQGSGSPATSNATARAGALGGDVEPKLDATSSAAGTDGTTSSTVPRAVDPTTTTAPAPDAATGGAALPLADRSEPPVEPKGTFRDGKVVLTGSVPSADVADRYVQRVVSVLGEGSAIVEMELDPRVEADTISVEVDQPFRFPPGEIVFDPELEALLDLGAAALQLLPETTLVVTGHTDDVGDEPTNLALSQARAQIVVDHMVESGVAADRVIARGAGESEPLADNATPEGRAINRRIEAVLEGVTPG